MIIGNADYAYLNIDSDDIAGCLSIHRLPIPQGYRFDSCFTMTRMRRYE